MATPEHHLIAPMRLFDPGAGMVVKEPEHPGTGYWTGCPAVLYEPERQRFLLTYRQRRPRGVADGRGWRCAVAASRDGVHFDDIFQVHKAEFGSPSMEGGCLRSTPGGYRLYLSYVDPADGRWRIDVMEAADPARFDPATAQPVLTAPGTGTEGVKDPIVLRAGPVTYLFASFAAARPFTPEQRAFAHRTGDIYEVGVTTHPTGLAISTDDGASFDWQGTVLDVGSGWDRYQARLTCVLPTGPTYTGFYDGSAGPAENYEERCGIAVAADPWHWRRLTSAGPWVTGPHRSGSVRYLDVATVGSYWWIYYEMTRADGSHELRVARIPVA